MCHISEKLFEIKIPVLHATKISNKGEHKKIHPFLVKMDPICTLTQSQQFFDKTGDKICLFTKTEDRIQMGTLKVIQIPDLECASDTRVIGCSTLYDSALSVSLTTFDKIKTH